MSGERVERRLAAILAADIAGYSRLMGVDEEGTLAAIKAVRAELTGPTVAKHRGRIVKTTGDGALVEFASVVDAVRCAVDVQQGMTERNTGVLADKRIEFRIGINLGDIIIDEDDIFGDGVNVAARLEALAEPGGICVSRVVRDQVRDKLDIAFDDMGEQQVKNIARPVRVFRVGPQAAGLQSPHPAPPPPAGEGSARSARVWAIEGPPRLSIVVLPFANLGGDPEQEYFADGITESLTTDLSRISGLFVIGRSTAFTYKGKGADLKQVGRDLNVRYALEGSVQRGGNRLRVNVQLIDTESGRTYGRSASTSRSPTCSTCRTRSSLTWRANWALSSPRPRRATPSGRPPRTDGPLFSRRGLPQPGNDQRKYGAGGSLPRSRAGARSRQSRCAGRQGVGRDGRRRELSER